MQKPEHQSYRIIVTGHSLGGGTATLLTLLMHDDAELQSINDGQVEVVCVTFGAPPVLDGPLANSDKCNNITNVVLDQDPVPRLCIANMETFLGNMQEQTDAPQVPTQEQLYHGGRVCLCLGSSRTLKLLDREHFAAFCVHGVALTDHLPMAYETCISRLDETAKPPEPDPEVNGYGQGELAETVQAQQRSTSGDDAPEASLSEETVLAPPSKEVGHLEDQLAHQRQTIEAKDQEIAALQARLKAAEATQQPPGAEVPVPQEQPEPAPAEQHTKTEQPNAEEAEGEQVNQA